MDICHDKIKTKDETIKVVKQWSYSNIADLRVRHKLVVVMHNNAGENESQEIKEFLKSLGVHIHFSTPKEQWQNGVAVSTIDFKAAAAGTDALNATFKAHIMTSPHQALFR
jgi:hypothetical protein